MFKKIKAYLKEVNPYMAGSVVIVIATVVIIFLILSGEPKDTEVNNGSYHTGETENMTVSEESKAETVELEASHTETMAYIEDGFEGKEDRESISTEGDDAMESVVQEPIETMAPFIPETSVVQTPVEPEVVVPAESEVTAPLEPAPASPENAEPSQPEEPEITYPEEQNPPVETIPEEPTVPEEPPVQDTPQVCEHSWLFESFYQESTCSNGGLENQICSKCGATQVTPGTPTGKHNYVVDSAGDCCSEEIVICSECNHREVMGKNPAVHMDVEDGFCYGCGQQIN